MASNVIISDQEYNEIISEMGALAFGEAELPYTEEQIKSYAIYPALRKYFSFFPIKSRKGVTVTGEFSVPFPDEETFGIVDARLNTSYSTGKKSDSPFINQLLYSSKRGSYGAGMYGTQNDYDMDVAQHYLRSETRASIDTNKAFYVNVNEDERKLEGYTNITGELVITWAKFKPDMNAVTFTRRDDVIKLSKAYFYRMLSMLFGLQEDNIDVSFNYSMLEDRANELEEQIITKWNEHSKVVLLRG